MCGIAGVFNKARCLSAENLRTVVGEMTDTLLHRGPDGGACWIDVEAGIALGHRRLAILDLTTDGNQPMHSKCLNFVLVFNGEIYNYLEIKEQLFAAGHTFNGRSDTEVMLAAFVEWGVEQATRRFNGMFAFALWDRKNHLLHLGRDRIGEKPLYYGRLKDAFVFASELKALRAHPEFTGEINRDALGLLMNYGYIPAPYSIYRGIHKLPPGSHLTIGFPNGQEVPIPYWSLKTVAESGVAKPFTGSDQEAANVLEQKLLSAVRRQMIADVPLGAFLSAGIDSSTIVALMQAQSTNVVKTFTIGFDDPALDEAAAARCISRHFATDHTELYVTADDALAVIPKLPLLYDEPIADSSQIPTYLVAKLARTRVTVCLSGDGGDEFFAGYNRHYRGQRFWSNTRNIPFAVRRIISALLRPLASNGKAKKLAKLLAAKDDPGTYASMVSNHLDARHLVLHSQPLPTVLTEAGEWANVPDFTERMLYLDGMTYLPDDILVKVDRASMGVSLESRMPFLDKDVIEFAWSLPISMKLRHGKGKWLLRQVLHKYIPRDLFGLSKKGFSVPLGSWLRGPLKAWADALLDEHRLRHEGFLDAAMVRRIWNEHKSETANWQNELWCILSFQAWLEHENKAE